MDALAIAFAVYLPILIAGLVIIITCLFAGQWAWSRRLCTIGLALTGALLLLLTVLFLGGALTTGWYHGEAGMAGAILFMAWIPMALEFFGLLAIAWRLGLLRRKTTRAEKEARSGEVSGSVN